MDFFDIHSHATTKAFLTHSNRYNAWEKFEKDDIHNWFVRQAMKRLVRSKASFTQMAKAGSRLVVIVLHPLEKQWAESSLIHGCLAKNSPLDQEFLEQIRQIPDSPLNYSLLLEQEYEFLLKSIEDPQNNNRIHIISSMNEFDPHKVNLVLSIEGAHALEGKGTQYQDHFSLPTEYQSDDEEEQVMLNNLCRLKTHENIHVFHLTYTHHAENPLCSHAFAIPKKVLGLVTLETGNNFKTVKSGIRGNKEERNTGPVSIGEKIARLAWDRRIGRRILLDVKHMSLQSRLDLYQIRKEFMAEHNIPTHDLPLIASHMGAAGISYAYENERSDMFPETYPKLTDCIKNSGWAHIHDEDFVKVFFPKRRGIGKGVGEETLTKFNHWTINLYNDDIAEILLSQGLMGIIMDKTILGVGSGQGEYFSRGDYALLFPDLYPPDQSKKFDPDKEEEGITEEDLERPEITPPEEMSQKSRKHLRYLCNNLLHIAKVGGRVQLEAGDYVGKAVWNHLCIGSDFDGFMDPIFYCEDVEDFATLEVGLRDMLPKMAKEGTAEYLESLNSTVVPMETRFPYFFNPEDTDEVEEIVRKFMYENGKRFLEKYFMKEPATSTSEDWIT